MNDGVLDPHLTTKIVSSYVRHHTLGTHQVSDLITSVHRALSELGQPVQVGLLILLVSIISLYLSIYGRKSDNLLSRKVSAKLCYG